MNTRRTQGQNWEARAERWLARRGLRALTRNYTCRGGELDLIMLEGEQLVFVEVRSRGANARVAALDSVDARKQRRLILAARHFLATHPQHAERTMRFDVLAIDHGGWRQRWQWIQHAFLAET